MGGPLPGGIRGRAAGSLLGARAGRQPHAPSDGSRRSRRCAGLRFTGPEIAELLGMPVSTVSGILTRIGMGRLGRLGLEPAAALRARAAGRADPHRRQEARPDPAAAPANAITGGAAHYTGSFTDAAGRVGAARPAGTTCTSRSTTPPAWPTPKSSPTRRPPPRSGSCAARCAFFASYGITVERVITDNGSPYRSDDPRASPAARSASATCAPGPRPPADQRQSRTLHPHHARRLGLRRDLRLKPRTHRRP